MSLRRDRPGVFSIDSTLPFADTLAAGLLQQYGGGDADTALADLLVLLPTRRACRSLREAFLRQAEGKPMLLPRMVPLGDVEEDELTLAMPVGEEGNEALDVPPAIEPMQRLGLLTRLILTRAKAQGAESWGVSTPGQAAALAAELARLLDSLQIEDVGIDKLSGIVPERFAHHWQVTLRFLEILSRAWPEILRERGAVDPAARRNLLLRAQARLWREHPPACPVIAAGSTGSIPATRELLATIAGLQRGAVVLPGLDRHLSDQQWQALDQTHPQFGLRELLAALEVTRQAVAEFPAPPVAAAGAARAAMWSHALQPAAQDASPQSIAPEALAGMTRLDCPTPQHEAVTIALILRSVLEQPGSSGALVTADRELARRVAGELKRWDIAIDDSAGTPLGDTPPVVLLRLIGAALDSALAPASLLALLHHPLSGLGLDRAELLERARLLDRFALRGPRPGAGIAGLRAALAMRRTEDNPRLIPLLDRLDDLLDRLDRALQPLRAAMAEAQATVPALATALARSGEAIAATRDRPGKQALWQGQAGEAILTLLMQLIEQGGDYGPIAGNGWPALFDELTRTQVVRARFGLHPRLFIWGPLEARLQRADVMVLGGLNEGSWPPLVDAGPWLTRPMRQELGLPLPERRIGLAAHDFVQAACAPVVYLTRAERAEGAPTVKARWLARLDALLEGASATETSTAARWVDWADRLDQPAEFAHPKEPRPAPPVAARPRQLSATAIELWRRDPYALYARAILRLRPLDPLDMDPTARDRGILIHQVLDEFLTARGGMVGADAEAELLALGRERFAQLLDRPAERAFWWPRFERVARWFVTTQRARQQENIALAITEATGRMSLAGPAGAFEVTAKADRIDRLSDGSLEIIDYKTGSSPSIEQVAAGYAPQLPLEALIALHEPGFVREQPGALPSVRGRASRLSHWRLRGKDEGGEIEDVLQQKKLLKAMEERGGEGESVLATLLRLTEHGLRERIARYDNPRTPYLARPRPAFAGYGEYDHLARLKEWAVAYGDD